MDYNTANQIASAQLLAKNAQLEYEIMMKRQVYAIEKAKRLSDRELLEAIYVKLYSE